MQLHSTAQRLQLLLFKNFHAGPMKLDHEQLTTLNSLLKDTDLDLPDYRRVVKSSGSNYKWLRKNIQKRNTNLLADLKLLLDIRTYDTVELE